MTRITELQVNGTTHRLDADGKRPLLTVLRDDLGLTGTKYGCGEGQCGACMVLADGRAIHSCITEVGTVAEKQITTVEGLESGGQLHPVQAAFLEKDALQCGYCTSGMIISGVALLRENPAPSREQIVRGMNRNICRCCVYPRIIDAIERAAASHPQPTA